MLELILLIVAAVGMGRIAESEDQSSVIWGVVTFLIGLSMIALLPALPFLRVMIAPVAVFFLLIVSKMNRGS